MPKTSEPWSLTSLREKLINIGAKVATHGRSGHAAPQSTARKETKGNPFALTPSTATAEPFRDLTSGHHLITACKLKGAKSQPFRMAGTRTAPFVRRTYHPLFSCVVTIKSADEQPRGPSRKTLGRVRPPR
jgi:hypothetical protein